MGSLLYPATFCFLHSGNLCTITYRPYTYSILRGCQSLLGFTAFRELLCPPIFLATLGDVGDRSPDIHLVTVTLLASKNRLPPPAS